MISTHSHRRIPPQTILSSGRLRAIVWLLSLAVVATSSWGQLAPLPQPTPLPRGAIARLGGFGDSERLHGTSGIRCSPDGESVAVLSVDQVVRVYETTSGRLRAELDGYQQGRVADFVFTTDSQRLLVVSNENEPLIIWNTTTGLRERALDLLGYRLFTGEQADEFVLLQQDRVVTFSIQADDEPSIRYLVHNRPQAVPLSLSRDGKHVLLYSPPPANAGARHKLSLHDIATSQDVDFPLLPTPIMRAEFSPTSDQIAVVCRNESRVYLRYANDNRRQQAVIANRLLVRDVCYSPDGRQLIAVGSDGSARVWEVATGRPIMRVDGHGDRLTCVAICPSARYLVTGSAGSTENCALVWDWRELLFPSTFVDTESSSFLNVWERLGSGDPMVAYRAVGSLVRGGEEAMEWLASLIHESIHPASTEEVAQLIDQLDNPAFSIRENASQRLQIVRDAIRDELAAAMASAQSIEVRLRLRRLLDGEGSQSLMSMAERRGWQRTIYALEIIDTAASDELLGRIAEGHPAGDLAHEAAKAVAR